MQVITKIEVAHFFNLNYKGIAMHGYLKVQQQLGIAQFPLRVLEPQRQESHVLQLFGI